MPFGNRYDIASGIDKGERQKNKKAEEYDPRRKLPQKIQYVREELVHRFLKARARRRSLRLRAILGGLSDLGFVFSFAWK